MDNEFPKLKIETYSHGFYSFQEAVIDIFREIQNKGFIHLVLPSDIYSQYSYSKEKRSRQTILFFLQTYYFTKGEDMFISFLNEVAPFVLDYVDTTDGHIVSSHTDENLFNELFNLFVDSNNPNIFKVDFYYDTEENIFRRKLDKVTTDIININNDSLDGDNKVRYEKCVSDFLSYNKDLLDNKLFYNTSLNDLKKVIENTLENNYKQEHKRSPRLHEKEKISRILFNKSNAYFENSIKYIIENIHHEKGGQPIIFNEEEYVYLWLELNNILYLLNKHKVV